jgi:hypothetical protein
METFKPEKNPIYHADVLQSLATCLSTLPQAANSGIWNEGKQNMLNLCLDRHFEASLAAGKGFSETYNKYINPRFAYNLPEFDS